MIQIGEKIKSKKVIIPALIIVVGILVLGIYFLGVYLPQRRAKASKSSAVVKASGAKVKTGEIAVSIPASSLPTGTNVEISKMDKEPPLESGKSYASDIYSIEAGAKPKGSVFIEIAFDPDKVEKKENLYAAWWDGNKWVPAQGLIDLQRNKLVVETNHFSWWAALYDRASGIWQDKIEPVHWIDLPTELQDELYDDLGLEREDVAAVEKARFSYMTKTATFVIGIANQIADVSGILGGVESEKELAKAVVEKIAEDVAKEGGGKAGELVVDVYEGFKTGYAAGEVVGHLVLKTGFATAQLQTAAPQILSYMLEKEMKHINENTSGLFEYLALYDSNALDKIDTYIFFYNTSAPERFRTKGVVLYYWSPDRGKWIKGKNIATTSDVLARILEKKGETASEETGRQSEEEPESPRSSFQFSKDRFPSSLLNYPLTRVQSGTPIEYESLSPLEQVGAYYEKEEGTDFIVVTVTKFRNPDDAVKGPEAAEEWARSNSGHSADLQSRESVLGYPFWISLFSEGGPTVIPSSCSIAGEYVIDISIEKQGGTIKGTEAEHREAMTKAIGAFSK